MQFLQIIRSVPRTFMRALTGTCESQRACRRGLGMLVAVGLVGCGGLEPVTEYTPITDPAKLYTRLTVNYRAATLSTAPGYDTLQLVATPRNALGEPLPLTDLPAPIFTSLDTSLLRVTAAGLVTARKVALGARVIASLKIPGNVQQVDTVLIDVTNLATPPVLGSVSIDPVSPDSAKLGMARISAPPGSAMGGVFGSGANQVLDPGSTNALPLAVLALDTEGTPIPGLRTDYWSLDSAVAIVNREGQVQRIRPGQARFVGRTRAYGITKTDTAVFTVTGYAGGEFMIQRTSAGAVTVTPGEVRIVPYGHVFWDNLLDTPVEVTFENPENVLGPRPEVCSYLDSFDTHLFFPLIYGPSPHCDGGGDMVIPGLSIFSGIPSNPFLGFRYRFVRGRQFPFPGVYTFRTQGGVTGRIVVSGPVVP